MKGRYKILSKGVLNMAKWQKIKYDGKGKPFVTFYGNRLNLDLFQLVNGPLFYCDSAFSCYSLEIDESGENARLNFSVC